MLDAAIRVLSERPDASVEDVAMAAGVTRQTVYAHYSSREALLNAAIDQVSADAIADMDAADLDQAPPVEALRRFLAAGWRTFERYPLLMRQSTVDPRAEQDRHEPVLDRLGRLIERGQEAGVFDRTMSARWLIASTIGLGHIAGEETVAGHMTSAEARDSLERSVERLFGVSDGVD